MNIKRKGDPGELASRDYIRSRLQPHPRDELYLHSLDVMSFVKEHAPVLSGTLLDYGCGGSPYRSLFTGVTSYLRADLDGEVDYRFAPDMVIDREDASVDVVLSTQVLEHVEFPARYLAEAYRLLRPGGCLLLTTHGLFEEHGCPYDFHRWTAAGLASEITQTGFDSIKTYKLTTGSRAAIALLERAALQFRDGRSRPRRMVASAARRTILGLMPSLNKWAARLPETSVVSGASPDSLYMAVAAIAIK